MYKKTYKTQFGIGEINDEHMISFVGEFNYKGNILSDVIELSTFEDELTGIFLYEYKDMLLTIKELRREYLKDHYNVKD